MRCRSARKLVFEFLDGLTDDTKRLELEKHIVECTECEKLASQLTRSLDLLHRAPVESPGENFAWKVRLKLSQERRAIQEYGSSQGAIIKSWNLRYAATAASALVLVVTVALLTLKSGINIPGLEQRLAGDKNQLYGEAGDPIDSRTPDEGDKLASTPEKGAGTTGVNQNLNRSNPGLQGPLGYPGRPVSAGPSGSESTGFPSAIDVSTEPAVLALDSIINVELGRLPLDQRALYLQERIRLLQNHLLKYRPVNKND